jgi:hypothetical protein
MTRPGWNALCMPGTFCVLSLAHAPTRPTGSQGPEK